MSLTNLSQAPLGKASSYVDQYDARLLFPIPRAEKRAEIGVTTSMPFFGADMWTAFEVSWLNPRGKPQLALAHITVPCESPNIIESKSLKLYLNSLNNTAFADIEAVAAQIKRDLGAAVWQGASVQGAVGVRLVDPSLFDAQPIHELDGLSLDRLDIDCTRYAPAPDLLHTEMDSAPVSEVLVSNLLKSNCLVTGQPDWGSVQISYSGQAINQEGLLQYIVSFRNHNEFHEQCVERIFMDIWTRCQPIRLAVYARYTRRGGLDINPYRTSYPAALPANIRTARQ
ncbi:MAG: NADPH-dependent 7-cyano-7-deazaguanine reductase QueF [Cytophagales bacterium]|nr:NADPH-dependent 7-cyano-7-deazaguanine reductase QueF [Cytophagales bacterium]